MIPAALRDAFAHQGEACAALGSPFMGQLCGLFAQRAWPDTSLTQRFSRWDGDISGAAQSLPLRLAGGLHALVLQGDPLRLSYPPHSVAPDQLWAAVCDAMIREDRFLNNWVDSAPQTNEVRRSAVIAAAGHLLAARFNLPMRLSELGASGGLNLMWDQFHVDLGATTYGPAQSGVRLRPDWTGTPPPAADPQITARRGVDLNPLDPNEPADVMRLRAYLWPDQADRMTRTQAAIACNAATVDRGDAIDWLADQLTHQTDELHLIYHTVAWQYFPAKAQARGRKLIEAAGASATDRTPLAWFSMETDGHAPGAGLTLRLWPGDITLDLGRADFHGRWVTWQG